MAEAGSVAPRAAAASVTDLTVTFRRRGTEIHALRGVSFQIAPAEILGLVGESGSGKSVLGLSLLGLLAGSPQTSGTALVGGVDMLTATDDVRRDIRRLHLGAVFQDPMTSLNPTMRIGRQVSEATGSDAETVRLLSAVGISDAARRLSAYPHELSGGLRQRVMIAMAVAGKPSLVIADEPTTALDVTVQAQVLALLARLRDELRCAVLLITHDLGVAAQVADRVAVMYAGRLAELGPTDEVLTRSAHPYAVALMRSRLSLDSDRDKPLLALAGDVPSPAAPEPGCAFAPRCALTIDICLERQPDLVAVDLDLDLAHDHVSACVQPFSAVRAYAAEVLDERAVAALPAPSHAHADPVDEPPAALAAPNPAVTVTRAMRRYSVGRGLGPKRDLVALRDVSLTVDRGESVAVVGESGSGKSTLLRVIAGLERPDGGSVEWGSGAGAQMVFQDAGASLTPWLTIDELLTDRLRSGGVPRRERPARVVTALRQVGLPAEVANARAAQLSGGQRQRVALARATVIAPEVLLCDEPTSALDVSLAASVLNLVADLRRELGMAVVFVTHDLSVARIVADRIAVMYLGRIVEIGTADAITLDPRHPYTQALVASIPDVGVTPPATIGEPASPLSPPSGCSFHPRCPRAEGDCADATLIPRLTRPHEPRGADHGRLAACIHLEEAS